MGATPTLIYLHGFGSSPSSKKARYFQERLGQHGVGLLVPDLADGDFEHLTITGQLAVVERTVAGRGAVLIGSSLGGYLAALYASQHPEIKNLILMAPAFSFGSRLPEIMGVEEVAQWQRTGLLPVFHYGDGRTRQLGYQLAEDAAAYPDFPGFSQPALILHGARDTVVPSSLSEHFAQQHANVSLTIFDSDHELMDVLEPMWAEMKRFLQIPRLL
ncbi:MAG: alpha/beta fold hydrolase [Acidobacteriota bacterium]|nr:alpha/beta fold hydrolase [Acidobacteriota bacterium]